MDSINKTSVNTDLYARIKLAPMREDQRQVALRALHDAETVATVIVGVLDAVGRLIAKVFEKPARLEHSH